MRRRFVRPKVGFLEGPGDEKQVFAHQFIQRRRGSANEQLVIEGRNDTAAAGPRQV